MAPRGAIANMSFTVDSASEDELTQDELNALPTPESNTENKAPTRKTRAPSKNSGTTTKASARGRPVSRRTSGGSVVGAKTSNATIRNKPLAKSGRKALAEREDGNGSDTEDVEDFAQEDQAEAVKPAKRGRPAKKAQGEESIAAPAPAKRGRKANPKDPVARETKSKATVKAKFSSHASEPATEHHTIPETQPERQADDMDIEMSVEMDEIPESMPPPPRPSARRAQAQPGRARQASHGLGRAGSMSDSERDPALRRKVGDLTRKLEALTTRYDTLKEAASSGKESHFEQLKKRTEQAAKDQDAIIKALKQQVAESQARTSDLTAMKKELAQLAKDNARLTGENKKLSDSLATSQSESKTLSSKLAAARSSVQPETRNVPGSAVKPRTTGVVLPGTAEAAKEAQLTKQKIDLYSDLTNLVILGVRKNEDEDDVYDCLQTGRNGTLHFHLTVVAGDEAYEDTEFVYQPLLNGQRDKELLDLLPDYLTEEICFPRGQAAKFYGRVVESMSQKIILEDE